MTEPRIVSLLPSGTEIVAALGFEESLVGRLEALAEMLHPELFHFGTESSAWERLD